MALEPVVELNEPIAMALRPDDDTLYIAERSGAVQAVRNGQVAAAPVIDLSEQISVGGERGLLGIEFSGDGSTLFASYTDVDGNSKLIAYPMQGDTADAEAGRELLAVEQPYANHNGGNVILGPDGMLYFGFGDGGAGGDPNRYAQAHDTLLGKLVRLDPETGEAPSDNPFVEEDGFLPEIFAIGMRNPWRFTFDRRTGDLWVADVGQDEIEEINVTPAGEQAGRNYGWSIFEGTNPYNGSEQPDDAVLPVFEYSHDEGCSVAGGYVYRGSAIPDLRGAYLYGDYCGGWVRALRVRDGEVIDRADLGLDAAELLSFGQDADGELYVMTLGGRVDRIVPAP